MGRAGLGLEFHVDSGSGRVGSRQVGSGQEKWTHVQLWRHLFIGSLITRLRIRHDSLLRTTLEGQLEGNKVYGRSRTTIEGQLEGKKVYGRSRTTIEGQLEGKKVYGRSRTTLEGQLEGKKVYGRLRTTLEGQLEGKKVYGRSRTMLLDWLLKTEEGNISKN